MPRAVLKRFKPAPVLFYILHSGKAFHRSTRNQPSAACVYQLEWQHDRGFPALCYLGCRSRGIAPLLPKCPVRIL